MVQTEKSLDYHHMGWAVISFTASKNFSEETSVNIWGEASMINILLSVTIQSGPTDLRSDPKHFETDKRRDGEDDYYILNPAWQKKTNYLWTKDVISGKSCKQVCDIFRHNFRIDHAPYQP